MNTNRNTYTLGKADYNKSGRRNCKCVIEWKLADGLFSMTASVWNPIGTDIYMGGQCIEEVAAMFPHDKKAQRMAAVWREWHLNDMQAGSPAQMAFLKAHPVTDRINYFNKACEALAAAGLNPDPNYIHNGKPYSYGHAWLRKELPPEVIAEIESWSAELPVQA